MTDRELLESIAGEIKSLKDEFKEKMIFVESRLSEHGEILIALRHASEIHHAKLDNLEIELAKLSGEQKEAFQALADMYGQHEFEITKLKRKPV